MPPLPREFFRDHRFITTSGVTFMPALRLSPEALDSERIMFAADYPHKSVGEAVDFLDRAQISDDDRARIYWQNAVRVFCLS